MCIRDSASTVSHAPKLFSDSCEIESSKTCEELYHFIRGLNPFPTAWTMLENQKLKVYETIPKPSISGVPGAFTSDNKSYLHLHCAEGSLDIVELQLQGKRRMTVKEFLNGYSLSQP